MTSIHLLKYGAVAGVWSGMIVNGMERQSVLYGTFGVGIIIIYEALLWLAERERNDDGIRAQPITCCVNTSLRDRIL